MRPVLDGTHPPPVRLVAVAVHRKYVHQPTYRAAARGEQCDNESPGPTANGSLAEATSGVLLGARSRPGIKAPARPLTQQDVVVALVAEGGQVRQVRRNAV